jgi:hypothetical protein
MIQSMRVFPLRIFPSHLELRMCHLHTDSIVFHHPPYVNGLKHYTLVHPAVLLIMDTCPTFLI